jgi:hypothetical protein
MVLANTEAPVRDLYVALLGRDHQLKDMDERLADIGLDNPEEAEAVLAVIYGPDRAVKNWYPHFRTWRKRRLLALARDYGDRLDEVAEFLDTFATELKTVGPQSYLQMKAHRAEEDVLPATAEPEEA